MNMSVFVYTVYTPIYTAVYTNKGEYTLPYQYIHHINILYINIYIFVVYYTTNIIQ